MENAFRNYFDAMPCFLTVQDRDLRIIDANRRFVENFGSYEGRRCYQVYKQRPEKCEQCSVEKTFRDGRRYTSEELVKTTDGREVWVLVNTMPVLNGAGEIEAVMEMSTDITDIKLLQRQLRVSQNKYRLLFEEVPCYISIQDDKLRIVEANRYHREAFGTSYGEKCYKVYKHRERECEPCPVRQTFKDGQIRTHEEVVTSQANNRINVLVCTAPIRDENGNIDKVVEMSTDITQIRQLQDKLTSIGLLIGTISHDIKGLLNGLDGGIYLVNSGLKKDDRDRIDRGWEIAMRNVDRIRSMVMDILYYAKDREPNLEKISAVDLAHDLVRVMETKSQKLNVVVRSEIDETVGEFEADPNAVRSLLINLIDNSLDACRVDNKKDEHFVDINLSGNREEIIFKINDNGIGMDRETREKAFSLFFSSKGAGGTGLGLFISNKIAQAHGGRIVVESEEGSGTSFKVILPRKRLAELEIQSDPNI